MSKLKYLLLLLGAALSAIVYFARRQSANRAQAKLERDVRKEATEVYGDDRRALQGRIKVASLEQERRERQADAAEADWLAKMRRARAIKKSWRGD